MDVKFALHAPGRTPFGSGCNFEDEDDDGDDNGDEYGKDGEYDDC